MLFNMLFSTYSRCVILITNYINRKVKADINVFQNPYMRYYYIFNNLRIELKPYGIENTKQNTKYKENLCSFLSKSSSNFFHMSFSYLQNSSH